MTGGPSQSLARGHPPDPAVNKSLPADSPPRKPRWKRCSRCGREKPLEEFARDASKASGFKSWCKACDKAKSRAYYERNRERVIARVSTRAMDLRKERGRVRRSRSWS